MAGKAYMRSHKFLFQAVWRLILPELLTPLRTIDANLADEIEKLSEADDIDKLKTTLKTARYMLYEYF
jgi:hypothetical protein